MILAPNISAYIELTKPRIALMVLVTTAFGYFLGGEGFHGFALFVLTLLGTGMSGCGASALNQYLERDSDALMERTRGRPVPAGKISPQAALYFGVVLCLGGCFLLLWSVNILAAFLALQSTFLYVLVYTPMKRLSWWNTSVGAIPGALPPLIGWAAATGTLNAQAWVLFAILYVWQHPHFYAIAWIYKDDYRRGGIKMLSVVHPDGRSLFNQVAGFAAILIPISLLPTLLGMSGWVYFVGALTIGLGMLGAALAFYRKRTVGHARLVLKVSVIYLPLLLIFMVADTAF